MLCLCLRVVNPRGPVDKLEHLIVIPVKEVKCALKGKDYMQTKYKGNKGCQRTGIGKLYIYCLEYIQYHREKYSIFGNEMKYNNLREIFQNYCDRVKFRSYILSNNVFVHLLL